MTSNATAKPAHQSTATDVSGEGPRATLLEGETDNYKVLKKDPTDMSFEEALTSEDIGPACHARLMTSTAGEALVDFFNAEMVRGTPPTILLEATWIYFLQFHASMSAQVLASGAGLALTSRLRNLFDAAYRSHFEASQEALQ